MKRIAEVRKKREELFWENRYFAFKYSVTEWKLPNKRKTPTCKMS
jgi:hypothetical protein